MPSHVQKPNVEVVQRVQEVIAQYQGQPLSGFLILMIVTTLGNEGLLAPALLPEPRFRTDDRVTGENVLQPGETVTGAFRGIVGGNRNVYVVTDADEPRIIKPDTAKKVIS